MTTQKNNATSSDMFDELFKDSSGQMQYLFREDPFRILANELGERYIEYRRKWVMAGDRELVTSYPLHINFALRDKCNFTCKSCVLSVPVKERKFKTAAGVISIERFKEIVTESVEKGLSSLDFGAISEPTLIPNLADYVRVAKESGVLDIMFTTNASLITPERSHDLIEAGLTWISFSLDAFSSDTFNEMRTGGNYDEVVANILSFIKIKNDMGAKLPITRVSFLKTDFNIHELNDFTEFWGSRVNVASVQDLVNSHYGYDTGDNFTEELRLKSHDYPTPKDLLTCSYPYQRLVIRANGDILPCCSFHGYEFVIGNINNDRLDDLWNSDRFKELRLKINADSLKEKPDICQKCIKSRPEMY